MIEGKTNSGFKFAFSEDVLDDFQTFEYLQKVDRGDISYMVDAMDRVLGKNQKEALKEHVKTIHGTVKVSDMFNEFREIMSASNAGKNS